MSHRLLPRIRIPLIVVTAAAAILASGVPAGAIIGGTSAGDSMPAVPALLFDAGAAHPFTPTEHCTGVLIDPGWVLTAQHCTNLNEKQGHPFLAREVTVTFARTGGTKEVRKVSQIQRAPGYVQETGVADIALLKLATRVTDISPLPLLGSGQLGGLGTIERFGYGITSPGSSTPSKVLNYSVEGVWHKSSTSDLPITINANCEGFSWPTANALWTYGLGRGAMAKGDSGGPVIDPVSPGSYAVAGITQGSLDLQDCTLTKGNPNTLGKHYLGLSNRVDQGSAEWGFISGLVPGAGVLSPGGWTGTRAGLPAGAGSGQDVSVNAMSCPGAGSCTAAGFYGGGAGTPMIETLSGGSWAAVQPPLPADAFPFNQAAGLTSISCADTGTCAAVGSYGDANTDAGLIETGSGGTWSATRAPMPPGTSGDPYSVLTTVTCLSGTSCIALGAYAPAGFEGMIDTFNGQGWSSLAAPLPAGASPATDQFVTLRSLSCVTASWCTAVGSYLDANGGTEGVIENDRNGAWTSARMPLPADAAASGQQVTLTGVACPVAGSCVAAGSYTTGSGQGQGFLARLSNGAWSTVAAPLPADASTADPAVQFGGVAGYAGIAAEAFTRPVACSADGACVAVGSYYSNSNGIQPLLEQLAGNTWTAVPVAFPPGYTGGSGYLNFAACPAAGQCTAGGSATANGNTTALADALGNGTWAAVPVTLPGDSAAPANAFLWDASCTASGFCAAAGGYYAGDNSNQSLLATGG